MGLTIPSELLYTLLGTALGYLLPGDFWHLRVVQEVMARRRRAELAAILADSRGQLDVGGLRVEHIATVQVFDPPLQRVEVTCMFNATARDLPADLRELEHSYLPRRMAELKAQGRTVDLNDRYALRRLRIERPQVHGARHNRPELTFEPSNFRYYLMLNDALDAPLLPVADGPPTIRKRHLDGFGPFEWGQLESLPLHPQFGVVTAVVTRDGYLVVAIRSGLQAITSTSTDLPPELQAAVSCAEGMLKPVDSLATPPGEEPNPFVTASRSLGDELGLESGVHFRESDVRLLGIGFDTERYQPVGIFFVQLAEHGFQEVYKAWKMAKDRHENADLVPVEATSRGLAKLLRGQILLGGQHVRLFSNHQQLAALLAGFHLVGAKSLSDALEEAMS